MNNTNINWKNLGNPFEDFDEEITQSWIQEGFTADQANEWLKVDNFNNFQQSLEFSSAVAYWLQKIIKVQPNDLATYSEDKVDELVSQYEIWTENFVWCDHCQKRIKRDSIFFSDQENDLDFCSESCQTKWNEWNNHLKIAQNYLDHWYPKSGTCLRDESKDWGDALNNQGKRRSEITQLVVGKEGLTGVLDVSDFVNLEELYCSDNQLTSLVLPKNNKLIKVNISDNCLTTFNYSSLNPLTLKELNIYNNNLEQTDIQVFTRFFNLINLAIGDDDLIDEGDSGNQFIGSFASFQELTKLETLSIWNLPLQPDFEYLPSSLKDIRCDGQIWKELQFYGRNLQLWQAHHPRLMKKANKKVIHLTDYQLITKKQISVASSWFKNRENNQESFNYPSRFTYSSFLVKDIHNFNFQSLDVQSEKLEKINKQLPLRLYNLKTNQVVNSKSESNINNYLILSYCWGTEWENNPQNYGQSYQTDLTKLGRKALNKVQSTYQFLKEQHNLNTDYIWIDNFCINQSDNLEKEQEVRQQREYYSNATITLIAIDAEVGEVDQSDQSEFMKHLVKKIFHSSWFHRSWTFQEGVLSKQTIFMFDDCLVDGRNLALYRGGTVGAYNTNPCQFITPFGWSAGSQTEKTASLNLGEALFSVTHRDQTVLVDKVYSILGLLPYGNHINVKYKDDRNYTVQDLENKLLELIKQAYLHNPKEIITYYGKRNPTNWWLPIINSIGSWQIEGSLNYDEMADQYRLSQIQQVTKQGIQLRGHWTIEDEWNVVEIDRKDDNYVWNSTLQFILNLKTKIISIKKVLEEEEGEKIYYSHGKQQPTDLFLDMINFKVIEGESKIKEYLKELETQQQSVDNSQQRIVDGNQQSVQLIEQLHSF